MRVIGHLKTGHDAAFIAKFEENRPALRLSSIVLAELEYGWQKAAPRVTKRIERQKLFAAGTAPIPCGGRCAAPNGKVRNHLHRTLVRTTGNAQSIGERDFLIAAQAIRLGAVLVTRNTREFSRVPDLVCEDWESAG